MAKKKIDNEIFKTLIEDYNIKDTNDIKDMLKDLLSGTIQTMLEAEIEHELGYAKHSMKDKTTSNARNGHSKKTVRSEYGNIDLEFLEIEMLSLSLKSSLNIKEKLLVLKDRFFLFMLKEWATEISRTILIIFMELMSKYT